MQRTNAPAMEDCDIINTPRLCFQYCQSSTKVHHPLRAPPKLSSLSTSLPAPIRVAYYLSGKIHSHVLSNAVLFVFALLLLPRFHYIGIPP